MLWRAALLGAGGGGFGGIGVGFDGYAAEGGVGWVGYCRSGFFSCSGGALGFEFGVDEERGERRELHEVEAAFLEGGGEGFAFALC